MDSNNELDIEEREWLDEARKQLDFQQYSIPTNKQKKESQQDIKFQTNIQTSNLQNYDSQLMIREENLRLLDQLAKAQLELLELRKLKSSAADFIIPETADLKEAKIIELARKNKDLRVNMAKEKGKNITLQRQVERLQDELTVLKETQALSNVQSDSSNDNEELKIKLSSANTRLTEARLQLQNTKQELSKVQRALQKEVGDNTPLTKILHEQSNWKGRAQEIQVLKDKVRELKDKITLLSNGSRASGDVNEIENQANEAELRIMRQFNMEIDKAGNSNNSHLIGSSSRKDFHEEHKIQIEETRAKKVAQLEENAAKAEELQQEIVAVKQKFDSVKARNKILEEAQKSLNEKFQTIVQKTKNDDEFIQTLQTQNQLLKKKLAQSASSQSQQPFPSSQPQIQSVSYQKASTALPAAQQTNQEKVIARQEQIIRSLKAELEALQAQINVDE
ncbi:MAG: hypothetical protein EZS28_021782 [Streblomastix strix]|uniref:Uncharacterized protein n=1 Tax=Streblomastix strix TaxID=222440 RepID=A0A5J4VJM0_9EUKA|nr:MAG: hypothetical protein EZS28_021782 [Streblomastix strix]